MGDEKDESILTQRPVCRRVLTNRTPRKSLSKKRTNMSKDLFAFLAFLSER